jgi:PTH1 family peptidyl-tRNA hydrolase
MWIFRKWFKPTIDKKYDTMKYLIIGLGNPGPKYENTRHNIGFRVLESLALEKEEKFKSVRYGEVAVVKHKSRVLMLLKPDTFMNLSGQAVRYWMQQEKIPIENILVITDDIALPFGKIRLKGKGSDGGHNGLKSIQNLLNSNQFARLRFGVGSHFHPGQQADYVLSEWPTVDVKHLPERITAAQAAILDFVSIGLQLTMTNHNGK